jgi:3-hydroxybutyryl-CoA dehydrogenase
MAPQAETIRTIGVVGAGQMGRGITQVAAEQGLEVTLVDSTVELARKGIDRIRQALDKTIAKGKLAPDERDAILARIHPSGGLADLGAVDFAIEAATEDQKLKQAIFVELDKACRPGAILASNTSSISITLLGASTKRPERVIGMHFMNPVPRMKLVEIIRALPTNEETYVTTAALAERLGKTAVESRDIPGFMVNRVLMPMINEACFALYEGLGTVKDIDTACRLGLNHPMGPLELADLVGLDTCLAILQVLQSELGDDKYRPCPLLRQYVAAGWLGRKAGRGFHTY